MKKLRLDINEVAVDSFELAPTDDRVGTVKGEESGELTVYPEYSCLCTQDPRDILCVVSDRYCSEAEPCNFTVSTTCTCNPQC